MLDNKLENLEWVKVEKNVSTQEVLTDAEDSAYEMQELHMEQLYSALRDINQQIELYEDDVDPYLTMEKMRLEILIKKTKRKISRHNRENYSIGR